MSYAINTEKISLGACKIWYWDGLGWVSIGGTSGGTTISYAPQYYDMKIDQLGETVVKKVLQGEAGAIGFGIAESGLEKLQLAIPFGTIYTSGGKSAMGVGVNAGGDMLAHALKLKVHPQNTKGAGGIDDETYTDDDFIIWKAGNAESVEIPFHSGEARVYKVKMTMFPDFDMGSGKYLFVIGDTAITGVSATTPGVKAMYPADGEVGVSGTVTPAVIMSEVIRELDDGVANASVTLIKKSDGSAVGSAIVSEKTISGNATAGGATTIDLAGGTFYADDELNGLFIELASGSGAEAGTLVEITDSEVASQRVTVAAWPNGIPDATTRYRVYVTKIVVNPESVLTSGAVYRLVVASAKGLSGNVQTLPGVAEFTIA